MSFIRACSLFLSLWTISSPGAAYVVDVEREYADGVVIASHQIHIPGYPEAYNGSIVRWNNELLMTFRITPDRKDKFKSFIGIIKLNNQLVPVGHPQMLHIRQYVAPGPCRAEDGRLIVVGTRLYLVYSDNPYEKVNRGGFRLYVSELRNIHGKFEAAYSERISFFEGEDYNIREKNWTPFEYHGQLLLAYSIEPHRVCRPRLDGSGLCDNYTLSAHKSGWSWGSVRGGSSAQKVENQFLGFFHSSKQLASTQSAAKPMLHYFMGAYTYDAEPPFELREISQRPIVSDGFYQGPDFVPYWKPIKAVFPCGYIFDERFIWVSFGKDDHEIWIAKLDKAKLFQSLVVVK
ncbi:MAG: hypothetical protein V4534_07065 [Myxococcota bacterium]